MKYNIYIFEYAEGQIRKRQISHIWFQFDTDNKSSTYYCGTSTVLIDGSNLQIAADYLVWVRVRGVELGNDIVPGVDCSIDEQAKEKQANLRKLRRESIILVIFGRFAMLTWRSYQSIT